MGEAAGTDLKLCFDARNVALGLAVLFLARTNGLLYLLNTIDDDDLSGRSSKKLTINAISFLVFFLFFLVTLLLSNGLTITNGGAGVVAEDYKFLHNFLDMPVVLLIFLVGVVAVLWGIGITILKGSRTGSGMPVQVPFSQYLHCSLLPDSITAPFILPHPTSGVPLRFLMLHRVILPLKQ